MLKIDQRIKDIDNIICRHIGSYKFLNQGQISQDILAQLRNFVELIMLKLYAKQDDIEHTQDNLKEAKKYIKGLAKYFFIYSFHESLQKSVSHYSLNEDASKRLMYSYIDYLFELKDLLKNEYDIEILHNIGDFEIGYNSELKDYYQKIAEVIDNVPLNSNGKASKYYIQKIRHFIVNHKIYYEVTLTPANDYASKFNSVIAFTKIKISPYYSSRFHFAYKNIKILNSNIKILVITGWNVSIRKCEYENLMKNLGYLNQYPTEKERTRIDEYLTLTKTSLSNWLDYPDDLFNQIMDKCTEGLEYKRFFEALLNCRNIVKNNAEGANIIRYLLYRMDNVIIKSQKEYDDKYRMEKFNMSKGSLPFDNLPYSFSLLNHNPLFNDLIKCIPIEGHECELLQRHIKNNTINDTKIFTSKNDLVQYGDIDALINEYNSKLYWKHRERNQIIEFCDHYYINMYILDTCYIIEHLNSISKDGEENYTEKVECWLNESGYEIDCKEKEDALKNMYSHSKVAYIYGSAGTGKTTLVNHLAMFLSSSKKCFLAQTNAAVDNLSKRITHENSTFSTIDSYLKNCNDSFDLIVIDECSTVSNENMRKILERNNFDKLLLVGDTYQIDAIEFGNWFYLIKEFAPSNIIYELTTPYRCKNDSLKLLWKRVRKMEEGILELSLKNDYSSNLDDTIFSKSSSDEIILCLNYNGVYGINNINRILQSNNNSKSVTWGLDEYKVNDPIVFNESKRFKSIIYNNMKGIIKDVNIFGEEESDKYIQFDILLDRKINEISLYDGLDLDLDEETGNTIARIKVYKAKSDDDDSDNLRTIVPFQIAYAISIHKAQGLEYNSVKLVITDEVEDLITHNIFYTAITRAQNNLKIYWSEDTEKKLLGRIKPKDIKNDVVLIKKYFELKKNDK